VKDDRSNRREVLTGMAATAGVACLPRAARAQAPTAMLRVGGGSPQPRSRSFLQGFDVRMRELGYVEGQNYTMDYFDLQGRVERYGDAMQQLVDRKPDVIVAFGPEASLKAALAATRTIPIVMTAIDYDPIALDYVTSLARPTGNVTGIILEQIELAAKRLQRISRHRQSDGVLGPAVGAPVARDARQRGETRLRSRQHRVARLPLRLRSCAGAGAVGPPRLSLHHDLAVVRARPRADRAVHATE
jgi:hypothetical protein